MSTARTVFQCDANGYVILPARAVLAALSRQIPSRHGELRLRHPLGTYNTSVNLVEARIARVISLLPQQDGALLEAQESLLYGLMQHMDDCSNILKGFTVDRRDFNKNTHVKAYMRAVKQYRSHIGKVTGRIKHQQGRLTLLTARLRAGSFPGYFISVGLEDGSVGPDPDIHPDIAAFSFNRDLRLHLCHLLQVSAFLAQALEGLTGVAPTETASAGDNNLTKSILDLLALKELYFPDEYKKLWPVLQFRGRDTSRTLVAALVQPAPRIFVWNAVMQLTTHGDGATRSWKIPYIRSPAS